MIMIKLNRFILIAALLIAVSMQPAAAREREPQMRLEAALSSSHIYEGEPVALTVTLISDTPDIAYARLISKGDVRGANVLNAPMLETRDDRMHRIDDNGHRRYAAVVYRAMLMPNEGTLIIPGLSFEVGEQVQTVVNHPFFGPVRGSDVVEHELSTRDIKQKIYRLPKTVAGYSGAIGDFTIDAILPPGRIEKGQDGVVIIRIQGNGYVDGDAMPELRSYFPSGLNFKASTSDSDVRVEGDRMVSVIEAECTFTPAEAGEYILPAIDFIYFNPATRSYLTAKTKPLTIKVQESERHSAPPVLHNI